MDEANKFPQLKGDDPTVARTLKRNKKAESITKVLIRVALLVLFAGVAYCIYLGATGQWQTLGWIGAGLVVVVIGLLRGFRYARMLEGD